MKLTLLSIFLMFGLFSMAQNQSSQNENIKKNSIYGELLGNGGIYSINYDRLFQLSKGIKIVPRLGFATYQDVLIFPLEANILLSKSNTSKNFFETGLGVTLIKPLAGASVNALTINGYQFVEDNKVVNSPFIIRAGFRHQKPTGGFMYRIGLLLFTGEESLLTLGIGLGYAF